MKKFFLITFRIIAELLFWVFVILGTPYWIFGIFFAYATFMTGDTPYVESFTRITTNAIVSYVLFLAILFPLRKLAIWLSRKFLSSCSFDGN